MQNNSPFQGEVIGIVGATGAGKSYVTGLFKAHGADIIEADQVGHQVLQEAGYEPVVLAFGKEILAPDQTIDRKKLGPLVFSDPQRLQKLNAIVHPLIHQAIVIQIERAKTQGRLLVLDAALLFELNLHMVCTHLILVWASEATRLKRIMARDGLTQAQAQARMASQRDFSQLVTQVDTIIRNG